MNKTLRFSLLSMLIMLVGNVFADDVTVNATSLSEMADNTPITVSGYTFTALKNNGTSNPTYNATGQDVRLYAKNTLNIKSANGNMTKITFKISTQGKKRLAPITADGGTIATQAAGDETVTWTGNAAEVTLTVGEKADYGSDGSSKAGQFDFSAIVFGEGGGDEGGDDNGGGGDTKEGQTPETAITVDRALEIINGLDNGAKSADNYYIKGTVTVAEVGNTGISTQYGNATFNMGDLVVFRAKGLENKAVTDENFLKVGDEVVVYGQLLKYFKDDTVTPEVAQGGYVYSINGKTKDDTPDPEDAITKGKTADSPMTVADALGYINNFPDGFTTSKLYYVQGTVSEVTEISTDNDNGNATFTMGDLTAFRMKGLENKNITDPDYVQDGDEVIICAKLQKYVKDGNTTPELSQGYIYSLNGKTTEDVDPYTFVGDGSKENPYTVEDLKHMAVPESTTAAEGQEKVWVKGYIVGSLNSSGNAILEGEAVVASNIGLGATADETDGAATIPVQLPTGDIRAALNVLDNPDNVGKELLVYGYILKYMSKTGVKNVEDYVLNGVNGISIVNNDAANNNVLYNIAGQRINGAYKGIVIRNGKKMVVK